jgi:hypothetical protein
MTLRVSRMTDRISENISGAPGGLMLWGLARRG